MGDNYFVIGRDMTPTITDPSKLLAAVLARVYSTSLLLLLWLLLVLRSQVESYIGITGGEM